MKSLYNTTSNQEIIDRINQLSPHSLSHWGKMTVSQMMEHCQAPLKVAFGELTIQQSLIGFLFGRMAKKKLVSDKPFDPNIPTAKEFIITHEPDFDAAKKTLIEHVSRFQKGPSVIKNLKHPFFGPMTAEEWDISQWKHLDHHLRQFGV